MPVDRRHELGTTDRWILWIFGVLARALAGVSINVVSGDLGYRWTSICGAVLALLFSGWWLRRLDPRTPVLRWFVGACSVGALLAAVASFAAPASWTLYPVIAAVTLTGAVVVTASSESVVTLLLGMLFVGGGVAFVGAGLTGAPGGWFASLVRVCLGAGIAVIGVFLIRGWFRGAAAVTTIMGVFCLAVAMAFGLVGGPATLMALVFASLGIAGIVLGTAVIVRPGGLLEAATAVIRPLAASVAVLYILLGAVAVHDARIVLAVADIAGGMLLGAAVLLAFTGREIHMLWAMSVLGLPVMIDGVQTAARGQTLAGAVSAAGGLAMLTALAYHYRDVAVAVWRYAFTVPAGSGDRNNP
jgi:hypothetical protein